MTSNPTTEGINFENTEIAFAHKSKHELNKSKLIFSVMNKAWVVNLLSPIGLFAIENNLPFAQYFVKKTIFSQFIGGIDLPKAQDTINMLSKQNVSTMLDYGVEGKEEEEDFERTKNENLNAVRFAATSQSVPVVTIKVTGLTTNDLVTNYGLNKPTSIAQKEEYERALQRLDEICSLAHQQGVSIFIDAEESWLQECVDLMVEEMMIRYNEERVVVCPTLLLFMIRRKIQIALLTMDLLTAPNISTLSLAAMLHTT